MKPVSMDYMKRASLTAFFPFFFFFLLPIRFGFRLTASWSIKLAPTLGYWALECMSPYLVSIGLGGLKLLPLDCFWLSFRGDRI